MATYTKQEIENLLMGICVDCGRFNLREEKDFLYCEDGDCPFFISVERYKDVTGKDWEAPFTNPY